MNSVRKIPSLKSIWRNWLIAQSPRRTITPWPIADRTALLMACLLIAILSSYKLLAVPDLKPGDLSSFDAISPEDGFVIDSAALQQKRSDLIPRSSVQIIDIKESQVLKKDLENLLQDLNQTSKTNRTRKIDPINLTSKEIEWLNNQSIERRIEKSYPHRSR